MRLNRKIDQHEMLRRWAIGEVYVELCLNENADFTDTLKRLYSKDFKSEKEAIDQTLKTHHLSLLDCINKDVVWYNATLKIAKPEFDKLYTLPVPDLARITNYTYKVSYAASIIQMKPGLNSRIDHIIASFKEGRNNVQLSGITLLAKNIDGPYTIVEGNGRLISLYQLHFLEKQNVIAENEIEVVIGLSEFGIA